MTKIVWDMSLGINGWRGFESLIAAGAQNGVTVEGQADEDVAGLKSRRDVFFWENSKYTVGVFVSGGQIYLRPGGW